MRRRRPDCNPFLDPSFQGFDDAVWERAMTSVLAQQAVVTSRPATTPREALFGVGLVLASVAILALATFRPGLLGSEVEDDPAVAVAFATRQEDAGAAPREDSMRIAPASVTLGAVGTDLRGRAFSGAVFRNEDLSGLDFTDANLSEAVLAGSNLSGAVLAGADLTGADLTGADLTGADLTEAVLVSADLDGAELAGADLSGADLTGVDLSRAVDVQEADFDGAVLGSDESPVGAGWEPGQPETAEPGPGELSGMGS